MKLKAVLDRAWNEYGLADALRRCRWQRFDDYVKTVHSHYRPAKTKVRRSNHRKKRLQSLT
jgi:hypothetical protein